MSVSSSSGISLITLARNGSGSFPAVGALELVAIAPLNCTAGGTITLPIKPDGAVSRLAIYNTSGSNFSFTLTDSGSTSITVAAGASATTLLLWTGTSWLIGAMSSVSGGGGSQVLVQEGTGGYKINIPPDTGNVRGNQAVDLQANRASNVQVASGLRAFIAAGQNNVASGTNSFASGLGCTASASQAHAEGTSTLANAQNAHAEGNGCAAGGSAAHAEGISTNASNIAAHAEGQGTTASAFYAHAEGQSSAANGQAAHAEGSDCTAQNASDHAEGAGCLASGGSSHAEGNSCQATQPDSHAEGQASVAGGQAAHAEGAGTNASGFAAHSEGNNTSATHNYSHAEGIHAKTVMDGEHAEGVADIDGASLNTRASAAGDQYPHRRTISLTQYLAANGSGNLWYTISGFSNVALPVPDNAAWLCRFDLLAVCDTQPTNVGCWNWKFAVQNISGVVEVVNNAIDNANASFATGASKSPDPNISDTATASNGLAASLQVNSPNIQFEVFAGSEGPYYFHGVLHIVEVTSLNTPGSHS